MNRHHLTLTDQQFSDMMRALIEAERYAVSIDREDLAERYDALWSHIAQGKAHTT